MLAARNDGGAEGPSEHHEAIAFPVKVNARGVNVEVYAQITHVRVISASGGTCHPPRLGLGRTCQVMGGRMYQLCSLITLH
jgi:hypothetical protein